MLLVVALCASLSAAAAMRPMALSRRDAAAALTALPALWLQPQRASAGLFGGDNDGPQGEFRQLQNAQSQIDELARKLSSNELRGDRPDDAIVVLQTLTIQFGNANEVMSKATEAMPLLDAAEQTKARELATRLASDLGNVKAGCRENSADKQLSGAKAASDSIAQYLAVPSSKYPLPKVTEPIYYSKDPNEFASQYFGIFSCEGQGLERIKGSNSCKASEKTKNINPFPTKNFLDFDFLTGESVKKK